MEATLCSQDEDTAMVIRALVNTCKRIAWYFASKKHVVITYSNGDIDIFPTAEDTEIESFMDFLETHDYAALAVLLGDRVKMINFTLVRSVEVVEGIIKENE